MDKTLATGTSPETLEEAIVSTIAYRDVFDFPIDLEEIHRFLHRHRCTVADISDTLNETGLCHGRVATDGQFYCLAHREAILTKRGPHENRAQDFFVTARTIARQLAHLPYIRMVAITGSLAARNAYEGADIDFLCVTANGRLWQARALVLVAKRLDAMTRKRRICPNFFLSTGALDFNHHSMYIAQELAQMVPLYGLDTYYKIRTQNVWADDFLPNAVGPPQSSGGLSVSVNNMIKTPMEKLYGGLVGTWFEHFESSRKMRRFNAPDFEGGRYSPFTHERTGHDMTKGRSIEDEWQKRLHGVNEGVDMTLATREHPRVGSKSLEGSA